MKDIFSRKEWYKSRKEEEKIYKGLLKRAPTVATASGRDLNIFSLKGNEFSFSVYFPIDEKLLDEFLDCHVKICGKLVDMEEFGKELWIGSIGKSE